jgi:hypothetical protein
LAISLAGGTASAQGGGATAQPANSDLYHVEFVKATPGQALAAAADLQEQDPKAPMQGMSSSCVTRKAMIGTSV